MRNPGDEVLRELERAASTGDLQAETQLWIERNRRGLCALCGVADELHGAQWRRDAGVEQRVSICTRCSALEELKALEASTTTYTGYLGDRYLPDPTGPLPPGAHAAGHRYIETWHSFPLAACMWVENARVGFARDGRTWRAVDRWGREWFGRNAGIGMITGMRLRRHAVPAPMRRTSGVRTIAPVRGQEWATLVGTGLVGHVSVEVLREQQRLWLERGGWPLREGPCPDCGSGGAPGVEPFVHESGCPRGEYFDDPGGAICQSCGERSTDPNHAANCSVGQ